MTHEDDLLYMKDDHVWRLAVDGLERNKIYIDEAYLFRSLKKSVSVKIKRGRQNVLNDVQAAPGSHLSRPQDEGLIFLGAMARANVV
ncbi:hypothetical protein AMTRI_Chr06g175150 [Amborella trichopoda]